MKNAVLLAVLNVVLAISWTDLPSFDWRAALIVGAIVVVAAVVVIAAGIATPFVAIQAGATLLGTALAVGTIALVMGAIAATAAGFYWGRQGDIKRQKQIDEIKRVSKRLDIYFEPFRDDPKKAVDFQCTLVFYEEDLHSQQPTVTERKIKIRAGDSKEFYTEVERQMRNWFSKKMAVDSEGEPRQVTIYMEPYPGEGVYERIKGLAENNGFCKCVVSKNDATWVSALPQ